METNPIPQLPKTEEVLLHDIALCIEIFNKSIEKGEEPDGQKIVDVILDIANERREELRQLRQ